MIEPAADGFIAHFNQTILNGHLMALDLIFDSIVDS